jgi:hypothetical protein
VIRWLLRLAVLAGLGFLAWKAWQLMQEDEDHSHEWVAPAAPRRAAGAPEPAATREPEAAKDAVAGKDAWVKPDGSGCPPGYPVKAKTSSKVYRVPGMFSYEESKPERCYRDEAAAIADGFTRAKR